MKSLPKDILSYERLRKDIFYPVYTTVTAYIAFAVSFLKFYFLALLVKNAFISFIEKFRSSRLTFLKDPEPWYLGRWAVITGATSGIGLETAKTLASSGVNIVLAVRNLRQGAHCIKQIRSTSARGVSVLMYKCDLASFESVAEFARHIKSQQLPISILVNNAGIFKMTYNPTIDGHEEQFQVSYLSHVLLTRLLLDTLQRNGPARVVWVSSDLHRAGNINLNKLEQSAEWYSGVEAYTSSKLAVVLAAYEFARHFAESEIPFFAVDPGLVYSPIYRNLPLILRIPAYVFTRAFAKSPAFGAESSIFAALSPSLANINGAYISSCVAIPSAFRARDTPIIAEKLLEQTENILYPYLLRDITHPDWPISSFKGKHVFKPAARVRIAATATATATATVQATASAQEKAKPAQMESKANKKEAAAPEKAKTMKIEELPIFLIHEQMKHHTDLNKKVEPLPPPKKESQFPLSSNEYEILGSGEGRF